MDVCLMTNARPFQKARKVNYTTNGYPTRNLTATEPSGDAGTATGAAVIDLTDPVAGGVAQNRVTCCFYGTGSDGNTFSAKLLGWRCLTTAPQGTAITPANNLWIPVPLFVVQVTLSSTPVGVAGKAIVATELFADTITLTSGNDDVSVDVVSPADNTIAHMVADVKGFQKIEFVFTTGGVATDCNALFALT